MKPVFSRFSIWFLFFTGSACTLSPNGAVGSGEQKQVGAAAAIHQELAGDGLQHLTYRGAWVKGHAKLGSEEVSFGESGTKRPSLDLDVQRGKDPPDGEARFIARFNWPDNVANVQASFATDPLEYDCQVIFTTTPYQVADLGLPSSARPFVNGEQAGGRGGSASTVENASNERSGSSERYQAKAQLFTNLQRVRPECIPAEGIRATVAAPSGCQSLAKYQNPSGKFSCRLRTNAGHTYQCIFDEQTTSGFLRFQNNEGVKSYDLRLDVGATCYQNPDAEQSAQEDTGGGSSLHITLLYSGQREASCTTESNQCTGPIKASDAAPRSSPLAHGKQAPFESHA